MKLHDNWHVTSLGLARLQNLSETELKKEIADKRLFTGFSTEKAKQEEQKIYEKIHNQRVKRQPAKTNTSKNSKGGRKNHKD